MVTAIERRKKREEAGVLEDDAIPISKNGSTKWSTQRYKTTETMANSIGKWEKSTIKNIPSKKAPPKNVTTGIYSFIHRGWMKLKYQLKRTTNEMPDLRIENNTEMYRYTKKNQHWCQVHLVLVSVSLSVTPNRNHSRFELIERFPMNRLQVKLFIALHYYQIDSETFTCIAIAHTSSLIHSTVYCVPTWHYVSFTQWY